MVEEEKMHADEGLAKSLDIDEISVDLNQTA
jgi:hypothetical protein